jgi:Na+-driven multidrug efflux pump
MDHTNQSFLATEGVGKLMRKYAIPCIISLLVGALYNIVDQIFIANADYLGSYGNAANTVVFPLTVIALAIAVMIGDGCCAFVSLSLGKKHPDDANRSVGNAIMLTIVCGVLLCAIYLLFQEPIISMFGGTVNAETFRHSKEYFFYISLGIPFYMFGQAMNPVIRADGSPKFAMISTLAGAVINIILDPIFIFVCKWGMMGAAVATVLGQVVTAILAVWYLAHTKTVRISKGEFALKSGIVKHTLTLGICSFLSQISLVAAMAAINNMIRQYGAMDAVFGQEQYAQIPMAVVGIVMKFFQIVISIVVGMAAGCIPIVGFNMGADLKLRVKKLFNKLLFCEATVGIVAFLIVELLPRQLIAIFGAANESSYYTDFAIKAFRIYLCMIILACVNKATFIFLQAMGKAVASTALSMIREIVFGVGFAIILPRFFGLDGVLYSMPVSDVLTAVISIIIIRITYKELDDKKKIATQKKEILPS